MLVSLDIRDFVLIARTTLEPSPGLTVLTGETGAGKSILLDALGLALGARASGAGPRLGADAATITASFDPPPGHRARRAAAEAEIAVSDDEPLTLRRRVGADGRGRAWVNDQPASVGLLRTIGAALVEIQGQFETHALLDPARHRVLLDRFGDLDAPRAATAAAYADLRQARDVLAAADARAAADAAAEADLRATADDLGELDPQPGEAPELAGLRARLRRGEQIAQTIAAARTALVGGPGEADGGAERRLARAAGALSKIADIGGARLGEALRALDAAGAEAAEAVAALDAAEADLDDDPRRLERVEARLFALRAAARRYGVAVDMLPALRTETDAAIAALEAGDGALAALRDAAAAAEAAFTTAAAALSTARAAAAARLEAAVGAELPALKLENARFAVAIAPAQPERWSAEGWDDVAFLAATNPGAAPAALNRIASGGESARFLLAVKAAGAAVDGPATLVFDEVDSGVGGATAAAVGDRLAKLAQTAQVLVVTHSPQVAARGHAHFEIAKASAGESVTAATRLLADWSARREEIARLLAGAAVTEEARAAADRLLHEAQPGPAWSTSRDD